MQKLLRSKRLTLAVFATAIVFSAVFVPLVDVNYDIMSYLPKDSPSTVALNKIEDIFGSAVSDDTRVMVEVSSIPEGLAYKERLANVPGVVSVTWLDDAADIHMPQSFIERDTLDAWYKDGYALFHVTFHENADMDTLVLGVDAIRTIVGEHAEIAGGAAGEALQKRDSSAQVAVMMGILVPVVLVIMIIVTSSWLEPLLFLAVIGISILINMGTNIFMGEISFVSQTTAAALQLAVSMDYSIFLIHSFTLQRGRGFEPKTAMIAAMKQTFPSIVASGITTLCGFAALMFMRFGIGVDLGLVLAKGVLISLATVIFLLPVLTLLIYKPLEKLSHRSFMPSFKGFSGAVMKIGVPVVVLVVLLAVPAFLAQSKNDFIYMSSSSLADSAELSDRFGRAEQLILLVPEGEDLTEKALSDELLSLTHVTDIQSYVTSAGVEVPFESLPKETSSKLRGGGYSLMLLTIDAKQGTDEGFDTVVKIQEAAAAHYDDFYLAGSSASLYDMRDVVTADNKLTTAIAIIAISIVILLTFRSLPLLVLLVGAIEVSIWMNLSVPYFMGSTVTYFGYMIISAVQLGATVDYAILLTSRYLEKRRDMNRSESAKQALSETSGSILTSALILCGAGTIIAVISTQDVVAELGNLLGRGAALSAIMVLFFLPNAIKLCDKAIKKLTYKVDFMEASK